MKRQFILCVDDGGHPESLEVRKFYEVLPDAEAAKEDMVRVVDESGEDYLYSKKMFVEATLPAQIEAALLKAT